MIYKTTLLFKEVAFPTLESADVMAFMLTWRWWCGVCHDVFLYNFLIVFMCWFIVWVFVYLIVLYVWIVHIFLCETTFLAWIIMFNTYYGKVDLISWLNECFMYYYIQVCMFFVTELKILIDFLLMLPGLYFILIYWRMHCFFWFCCGV